MDMGIIAVCDIVVEDRDEIGSRNTHIGVG